MALTLGFEDDDEWQDHFDDHHHLLGIATKEEYLGAADLFLGGPLRTTVLECTRRVGDIVRYDTVTQEGPIYETLHSYLLHS